MASKFKLEKRLSAAVLAQQAGRHDEALAAYQKILRQWPDNPYAIHYSGLVHYQRGDYATALPLIERSLERAPEIAEFHLNHGNLLKACGRTDEALLAYGKAAHLAPDAPVAHYGMALCEAQAGRLEVALASFRRALEFRPDFPEALFQVGKTLGALGQPTEGAAHLERYLAQRPGDPDGWTALARLYLEMGDPRAISTYRKVIELKGRSAFLLTALGCALNGAGQVAAAEACHREALALDDGLAAAHCNLASTLKDQGRAAEAVDAYRAALEITPDDTLTLSNRLLTLNYLETSTRQGLYEAHVAAATAYLPGRHGDSPAPTPVRRGPGRTELRRVGFLSPDFCRHPVGFFIEPVLASLATSGLELVGFHDAVHSDDQSDKLKTLCSRWETTAGRDDTQLETLLRDHELDILVELSGHTSGNRLAVVARRPAALQLSYLGYPGTTGLHTIDGRICDRHTDPPGTEAYSAEALLRMPDSYFCFQPRDDAPPVAPPPVSDTGEFTFGSFNNLAKVSARTVHLWARVLLENPGSRLLLKHRAAGDGTVQARLRQLFAAAGVDHGRLCFAAWAARDQDHLAHYAMIDVALDTTPYNGATTTCEALWMGVPVISLVGDTHAARVGTSLLTAAGLGAWAVAGEDAFVDACRALARDRDRLSQLRLGQRDKLRLSPLLDRPRFGAAFANLLARAWGWRQGHGTPAGSGHEVDGGDRGARQ